MTDSSNDSSRSGRHGPAADDPSRRDLLDALLVAGGCLWAAGVAVPTTLYLWPARARGPGTDQVDAGSIDDFPVGTARMIQQGGKPILVLRVAADDFRAFSAVCTHLGCVVAWDEALRRIHCPCHAGFFGPDGTVLSGPPPRPLTRYRTSVRGNKLRVHA